MRFPLFLFFWRATRTSTSMVFLRHTHDCALLPRCTHTCVHTHTHNKRIRCVAVSQATAPFLSLSGEGPSRASWSPYFLHLDILLAPCFLPSSTPRFFCAKNPTAERPHNFLLISGLDFRVFSHITDDHMIRIYFIDVAASCQCSPYIDVHRHHHQHLHGSRTVLVANLFRQLLKLNQSSYDMKYMKQFRPVAGARAGSPPCLH